ncbi:MAG TPA: glycosyltransferase [Ktedonobacteraceae bacterium]|jgi:sugar transferase (PEP-CTERM/EpsH1 system associated)|nr:glycosyltransferase [Ktedonobacteraceae bacterium]
MRILFVTPYPPSCFRVRSASFIKHLQRDHDVTVLALCRSVHDMADCQKLRQEHPALEVITVQESKWRASLRAGRTLLSADSMHVSYARSPRLTRTVQSLCAQQRFDVIHVEHLRGMAALAPLALSYPLVWDAVDCISLLYKQAAISARSRSWRFIASLEQERIRNAEAALLHRPQRVLLTSERDRQAMLTMLETGEQNRDEHISVLPNGVDLDYFRPLAVERKPFNLVFSGKMNYHPNVATVLYLYEQVMPLIWQQQPKATLTIVGSFPPAEIQRLARHPRVEVTGYVDDLRPYIARAEVMLCPMVYATGIQNKVLESMALGTPVIISPKAAEALQAVPGRDLLVAETLRQFVEMTLNLFNNPARRAALSQAARAYVERHHNWQAITQQLVEIYSEASADYTPFARLSC